MNLFPESFATLNYTVPKENNEEIRVRNNLPVKGRNSVRKADISRISIR
jgi:hypothetical protein